MKVLYISLPIRGYEDTYEQRIDAAMEYLKRVYPKYDSIITTKEVAECLEDYQPMKPKYKDYLLADMEAIAHCDAIIMCRDWYISKGCSSELAFAEAIGVDILYQ